MNAQIDYRRIFQAATRMEDSDKARRLLRLVAAAAKPKDMAQLTNKDWAAHYAKRKDDIDHLHRELKAEFGMVESEVSRKLRRHFANADIKSGDLPGHEFHGNQYAEGEGDEEHETLEQQANRVEKIVEDRRTRYRDALSRLPDGTKIKKWTKHTIGKDVIWIHDNGRDGTPNVLHEVGQKDVDKVLEKHGIEIPKGLKAREAIKSASSFDFLFDPDQLAADLGDVLGGTLPDMLLDAGQDIYSDFLPPPEEAKAFITERQNLMSNVAQETFDSVKAELQDGLDKGESYRQLSKRLSSKFDEINEGRAQTVASTEVASAYGYARNEAMKQSGAKYKLWVGSGRPPGTLHGMRPAHAAAHYEGQTVAIDEPFRVGGALLMFPTDSSLGAGPELTINCHCVALPAEGPIRSGEGEGHPFRGNQYTEGESGGSKISESDKDALLEYLGSKDPPEGIYVSDGHNGLLRGFSRYSGRAETYTPDQRQYYQKQIGELQALIDKTPTARDQVFYRGVRKDLADQLTDGTIFQDKGFTSITSDKKIALERFTGWNAEEKGRVFEVHVPKGTGLLNVDSIANPSNDPEYTTEREHLLGHGTRFRVQGNVLEVIR